MLRFVLPLLCCVTLGSCQCPAGWVYYSGTQKCFVLTPKMTWDQANAQCKAYGGFLASIHNREESVFLAIEFLWLTDPVDYSERLYVRDDAQFRLVHHYAASVGADLYVHIGLRADAARQWTWTDGTPYSFTNWAAGQPDNYLGAQYCGSLVTQSVGPYTLGQWDDYNCAGATNAFCELDLKQ